MVSWPINFANCFASSEILVSGSNTECITSKTLWRGSSAAHFPRCGMLRLRSQWTEGGGCSTTRSSWARAIAAGILNVVLVDAHAVVLVDAHALQAALLQECKNGGMSPGGWNSVRERVVGHGGGGEATRLFGGRVASVAVRACCPRSLRGESMGESCIRASHQRRVSVQEGQAQFLLNTAKCG